MKQNHIGHAEPAWRDKSNWLVNQSQTCQQFHRTLARQASYPKSNPVQNLTYVGTRWLETKSVVSLFISWFHLSGTVDWMNKCRGGCSIFLRGWGREVCRWVLGWAACSVVTATSNQGHQTLITAVLYIAIHFLQWIDLITKKHKEAFFQFFSPRFIKTENIFHLILVGFMSSSPPCSDHAITSLRSLIKTFIQAYFAKYSPGENFYATFENSPSKVLLSLLCLFACCSAYQADKLSWPLAISPKQPMPV